MRIPALVVTWVILLASSAWAGEQFRVEGSNPGSGSGYAGDVIVGLTGQTVDVTWHVAGATYRGTGVLLEDALAVTYRVDGSMGVAVFKRGPSGIWSGVWSPEGSRQTGTETWYPR